MKLNQLLENIPNVSPRPTEIPISGIHYDSRQISKGSLFIAIRGLAADGHAFLKKAEHQGASAALVEKIDSAVKIPQFIVPDTREALAKISARWFGFPSKQLTLVGITGTNGKTTTSFILESIAKSAGLTPGVIGTINYRYKEKTITASHTTPESYDLQKLLREMADAGVNYVIMEVSSHGLELKRVFECEFDVAAFTNLTQDHLDFHPNMEEYFRSKSILFDQLISWSKKPAPTAVLNIDDPRGVELKKLTKARVIAYGIKENGSKDLSIGGLQYSLEGLSGSLTGKISCKFQSSLIGTHNVYNILTASASAFATNIKTDAIIDGIRNLSGVPGRLQRVSRNVKSDPLVLVDYAHTDDALRNVLSTLQALPRSGRILTLMGCGGDRDPKKRPLMGQAAMGSSDFVIVTSDNPRTEDPHKIIEEIVTGLKKIGANQLTIKEAETESGYLVESDRKKAIRLIIDLASAGDIVLIAGKGHENYQIIGTRKIDFDDSKIALEALKEKQK